jgi:hypothetical protein
MERKLTYYFYKYDISPKEKRTLEEIVNEISLLPFAQREKDVDGSGIRLEEFVKTQIRGIHAWQGMVSQFRETKLPSKVVKGMPLQSLGLQNNENLAEPTGFVIIPAKKVLVYSKILSGVSLGRFEKYLLQHQIAGPIHITDIVLPEVLRNLKEHTFLNQLKLRFKLPVGGSMPSTNSDSVKAGIQAASKTGGLSIEIKIKAGRKKSDSLNYTQIVNEAETILSEHTGAGYLLEALEAYGKKSQDGNNEKIPLVNWRLHSEQKINATERTLNWNQLKATSRAAVVEKIDEI